MVQLVKQKCSPILLYALKVCNLNKRVLQSLDFTVNRFFMKLFRTSQCSTLVRNCCKGDVASQWEIAIFGHLWVWNPWTDQVGIWHDWLRPDNPRQFWWRSVKRGVLGKYPTCTTIFCPFLLVTFLTPPVSLQQTPLNRFWRAMAQTTCLCNHWCLLGVSIINA